MRTGWVVGTVVLLLGGALLGPPLASHGPEQPTLEPSAAGPGDPTSPAAFRQLHRRNITGAGVRVGIVDPTGFDPSDPDVAARVEATRSFDRGNTIDNRGFARHGTAAAETVATVAPGAALYLANFKTESGFVEAVEWLRSRDVDVIVAPLSFYGKPDDGTSSVSRAVEAATADGVVVVVPTGNLARGHWAGTYGPGRNGTLAFDGGEQRNRLAPIQDPDRVVLWLSWDRVHRRHDYDLVLYRRHDGRTERVARSRRFARDPYPNERIVVERKPGTYSFAVTGPTEASRARVEIVSPTHAFSAARSVGSIAAPATAEGVIAVGAFDTRRGRLAAYSSRGPTADGRIGVDVVAPGTLRSAADVGFVGSSSAAAYTGGIVALLLDAAPELTPLRVEETLEYSVTDVGAPAHTVRTGYGLVDPVAAVDRIERE